MTEDGKHFLPSTCSCNPTMGRSTESLPSTGPQGALRAGSSCAQGPWPCAPSLPAAPPTGSLAVYSALLMRQCPSCAEQSQEASLAPPLPLQHTHVLLQNTSPVPTARVSPPPWEHSSSPASSLRPSALFSERSRYSLPLTLILLNFPVLSSQNYSLAFCVRAKV